MRMLTINLKIIILAFLFIFSFIKLSTVSAQENLYELPKDKKYEAIIINIQEEREFEYEGRDQLYQKLELEITKGDSKGERIVIETGNLPVVNAPKYQVGDKLLITSTQNIDGNSVYYISDYLRQSPLYLLFFIFVGLTILIGRLKGVTSLLGMGFSFLIIFTFILPQIMAGRNPVFIAILASLIIIPVTFFLSHGLNKKTVAAIVGTIISLVITGLLASIFVEAVKLTGFASEEASFLEVARQGVINIKGLLLAGIIIGVLGILDDITVSQSAIVHQLKQTSPNLTPNQIFSKAMDIGRDHIASVVNTLVLVYTGAALPLLLLFINNPSPFTELINYEFIAEEIVRTLVASIGLILAVPITTFLAAYSPTHQKNK